MYLKERQKDFKAKVYSQDVALEQDLRRIYDNKDIDVVSIASLQTTGTALAVIWACQAGKDVLCRKTGFAQYLRRP
jgi:G:T-mismatch repair DNA endonuclease (very short patch repair protein)